MARRAIGTRTAIVLTHASESQRMTQHQSVAQALPNNAMKLTRSAWVNGRARPLQLIAVLALPCDTPAVARTP